MTPSCQSSKSRWSPSQHQHLRGGWMPSFQSPKPRWSISKHQHLRGGWMPSSQSSKPRWPPSKHQHLRGGWRPSSQSSNPRKEVSSTRGLDSRAGDHVGFSTLGSSAGPIGHATHCSWPNLGQPWLSSFWVEARRSSELGKEVCEGNLGGGT